jgi:hypothetical protein
MALIRYTHWFWSFTVPHFSQHTELEKNCIYLGCALTYVCIHIHTVNIYIYYCIYLNTLKTMHFHHLSNCNFISSGSRFSFLIFCIFNSFLQ